jgi:hypothetical protein
MPGENCTPHADTKARDALIALRNGMRANDDYLDDDTKPNGAQSPTGDDYNVLFDLVLDALSAAGIQYRED